MTFKIGITGATGVLGKTIQNQWKDAEWYPFKGRIENLTEVKAWLDGAPKLDAIIHFAAMVPVAQVEADPIKAFRVNVEGSLNLLEAMRGLQDPPWMFFSSSSHVYASSSEPLSELSLKNPITRYGLTKLQSDEWAEHYRDRLGLPICVGRIFSYSSPYQAASYFIPAMIQKIKNAPKNSVLEVPGLLGSRDFLDAEEICRCIQDLFHKKAKATLNIGTGEGVQLLRFAEGLKSKLNRSDLEIKPLEAGTNHLTANVQKLNELGMKLSFNLDSFLDKMIQASG